MKSHEPQFSNAEQQFVIDNAQSIMTDFLVQGMNRSMLDYKGILDGISPLTIEGQRQILLAYCASKGNIVAQHILSREYWHTSAWEILSHWGYFVGVENENTRTTLLNL